MNTYEASSGFNSNHGQTTRPSEHQQQKTQNLGTTWGGYNGQLESMYYGGEHQPMFVGPYEGKQTNYPQYPSGTIHQPVPTQAGKCQEACCQQYQDHRYPLNPAPLRYQPSAPRYAELANTDSRQYFTTDRRSIQPSLSRKKVYPTENGYPISDRHFSGYMGRGQLHMDSRQQMQMMRAQYPMYPPYWGGTRGWTGPRMNCPPPPYHQSVNQGAQLQAGLKLPDGTHYMDPTAQKMSAQHRRGGVSTSGGTEIIRPVPEPKRTLLDPNLQSCYEFSYPTGFIPYGDMNKIQGTSMVPQSNNPTCKMPNDKQYHPHQMQFSVQNNDRNMINCNNPLNDLGYPMNFPLPTNETYLRSGMDDAQQISDSRKVPVQYDSSLGKKRPDLDVRQFLATWDDDEDESTRLTDNLEVGNNGTPYIVVDCRSLEGETAAKLQDRLKPTASTKSRSSSPNSERKRTDDQSRSEENPEFQAQTNYNSSSMPNILSDTEKNINFWNSTNREGEGIIGKGGAFQPLDCSKRDVNLDPSTITKRNSHSHNDIPNQKVPGNNDSSNMSLDALVSYYGDNRRAIDPGYDIVEMTERFVNNTGKPSGNNQLPSEISRPCDPRLQQSQVGTNPSIYNKVASRYPTSNYQPYKPPITADPYYNYKHPLSTNKYFGYDNVQLADPNYEYHKIVSDFDSARLYGSKEAAKDPRRMYHPDIDKQVENGYLDTMRKTQIADCFQDKSLEFTAVDPDQFMNPIIKKPDFDNRDKSHTDKTSTIRERMDIINNESQSHSDKAILITSQLGPPELFKVPYSPEKDISLKDNIVTLHSADQTKNNTITVEVPYVQQYSNLVKLSEEISRTESSDVNKDKTLDQSSKTSNDEFKKPQVGFKLKRLPNSKEWTVEGKKCSENSNNDYNDDEASVLPNLSADSTKEREILKSSITLSNLNMPSLDDIRDEVCETDKENSSKTKPVESETLSNKPTACDEINKIKHSTQLPQMAIVQPLKLTQQNERKTDTCEDGTNQENHEPLTVSTSQKDEINCISEKSSPNNLLEIEGKTMNNEISKHGNFRTHKKIQNSLSKLQSCLASSHEDFLQSQDIGSGEPKETYSPFPVYSDCDMNSQIPDYFKMDDRTTTSEKLLDPRMPSSPGVEGMFEDINSSNQNQVYQSKTFQDLTDPNNENPHFQSFSSMFSDDGEKVGRPDGSVLQMNNKKITNLNDIDDQQTFISLQDRPKETTDENSINKSKTSPPIPPISLKLNETKKVWCIANKDQGSDQDLQKYSKKIGAMSVSPFENLRTNYLINPINEFETQANHSLNILHDGKENLVLNQDKQIHTAEPSLCVTELDKHINPSYSVDNEKFGKVDNNEILKVIQPESENKCMSIIKYYPKTEILERIRLSKNTESSEVLVFDENGTHIPKECVVKPVKMSESKYVVQCIVDYLIEQTINYKCAVADNSSLFPGRSNENIHIKPNHENLNNSSVNITTVIKFDSSTDHVKETVDEVDSGSINLDISFDCGKDSNKLFSSVKTIQPEQLFNQCEEKKTIRSIFSPMSDGGDIDSIVSDNSPKTKCVEEERASEIPTVKGTGGDSEVLDFSSKKSKSDQVVENDTFVLEPTTNSNNNLVSHFDRPRIESSFHENECKTKNDFEIDVALELMGLSNVETLKSDCTQVSSKVHFVQTKTEEESKNTTDYLEKSLTNSLNHEYGLDHSLNTTGLLKNNPQSSGVEEDLRVNNKPEYEQETLQNCVSTITKEHIRSTGIEKSHEEQVLNQEVSSKVKGNSSDLDDASGASDSDTARFDSVDSTIKNTKVSTLLMKGKRTLSEDNCVNLFSGDESTMAKKHKRSSSHSLDSTTTSKTQVIFEDFEAILETSVIVRNKTCSTIVSNELMYPCHNATEKSSALPAPYFDLISSEVHNTLSVSPTSGVDFLEKDLEAEPSDIECPDARFNPSKGSDDNCGGNKFNDSNDHQGTDKYSLELSRNCDKKELNEGFKGKQSLETTKQNQFFKKTSVIISKESGGFYPSQINEIEKLNYCMGESCFIQCNDSEIQTILKKSNFSYFHDFKKRKWQKFCKLFENTFDSSKEDSSNSVRDVGRDSIINFGLNCNLQNEIQPNPIFHLISNSNMNKQNEDDRSEEGQMKSVIEKKECVVENCSDFVIDTDRKVNLKSEVDFIETSSTTSTQCLSKIPDLYNVEDAIEDYHYKNTTNNNDPASLKDNNDPSSLKDKTYCLVPKTSNVFCIRRDSLQIHEPEAVLKEMFSPDSEIEDSESKLNECPTIAFHNQSPEGFNSNLSSDTLMPFASGERSESDHCTSANLSSSDIEADLIRVTSKSDKHAKTNIKNMEEENLLCEGNEPLFQNSSAVSNVKETNRSSNLLNETDFEIASEISDDSKTVTLPLQEYHSDQVMSVETLHSEQYEGECHSSVSCDTDCKLEKQSVRFSHDSGFEEDTLKTLIPPSCEPDSHSISGESGNFKELKKVISDYKGQKHPVNLSRNSKTQSSIKSNDLPVPQDSTLSDNCMVKTLSTQSIKELNTGSPNKSSVQKDLNSNTCSDILIKSCHTDAIVSCKDVVPSNEQISHQTISQIILDIDPKDKNKDPCVKLEKENTNNITSVEDSLRNSQHINKETFPLQCLVEAALVLEKQMNSSNLEDFYSQHNKSLQEENAQKTSLADVSVSKDNSSNSHELTSADREVFSKFEENSYNLRASTRIVTSSSSNIPYPYPKRKYRLKSSNVLSKTVENQKKPEKSIAEKTCTKKRKSGFTYPKTKRRKKVNKEKQKAQDDKLHDHVDYISTDSTVNETVKDNIEENIISDNHSCEIEITKQTDSQSSDNLQLDENLTFEHELQVEENVKSDFGGPLLITNQSTGQPAEENILCLQVNQERVGGYVNNLNIGELEVISENSPAVLKGGDSGLENGHSLVIIIEDLGNDTDKAEFSGGKGDVDIFLGSEGVSTAPILPHSRSDVDDSDICSDMLTADYSINESCVCPSNHEESIIKEKSFEILENEPFSKTSFEVSTNIEHRFENFSSVICNQEILHSNGYEDHTNLDNDISNWPFVEEEVAEFDINPEPPNKIPEEGRKFELKCSLPWKKIFSISKTQKKKNKSPKKGLELGPAKVEVRLRAPSAEWKVISDYHENSTPVVKVKRLILQRGSDVSSYSEKESEEEIESKNLSHSSEFFVDSDKNVNIDSQSYEKSLSGERNLQPIVLLRRNPKLDELTLSMDSKPQSHRDSTCSSQASFGSQGDEENSKESFAEIEVATENYQSESSISFHSKSPSPASLNNKGHISYGSVYQVESTKYETYSPSGGNDSSNEKPYSPSDPHYSPENNNEDCESNSSNNFVISTKVKNNTNLESDNAFLDENHLKETAKFEYNNGIVDTKKDTVEETQTQMLEEPKIMAEDFIEASRNTGSCSQISSVSDASSPTRANNNNSFETLIDSAIIEKIDLFSQENVKSSEESNGATLSMEGSSDTLYGRSNGIKTNNISTEMDFEQKQKSARKMPKNFFVRKRSRKNKNHFESTDDKSQFSWDDDSVGKPENISALPSQDSIAGSIVVGPSHDSASCSPLESSQSESHSRKSSSVSSDIVNNVNNNSDSELSTVCEHFRLQCGYDLEDSQPVRLNDSPLTKRFEEKQRLRDSGRGLKRPSEGHSKEDTKRRRKRSKSDSTSCHECDVHFQNKEQLCRHKAYRHNRRRELHHCLLCQRSFSSAVRHSLHLAGRSHRHLELTQRHTMHAMHHLLVGGDCPLVTPLNRAELRTLQWRPEQPGYTHFYHQPTPLQAALQELNSDVSEDTSEERPPND